MAEDRRKALLEHYRKGRKILLDSIQGLTDTQMIETSIDGWSVKDHLAHIALWDDVRADEVVRISAGHDTAWRLNDEYSLAFNEMSYRSRAALPLSQVRWELGNSRKRLNDALASAAPRALDASLYGAAGLGKLHEHEHAGWIRRWRTEKGI